MAVVKSKRMSIAHRDPEIQKMWRDGATVTEIMVHLGKPPKSMGAYLGVRDLTPQPLGCRTACAISGESGEARAFRRFPITAHKPAWD